MCSLFTTSEQSTLCSVFLCQEKHPPASLLLLIREKSRLLRLCLCKRRHDAFAALPTFHGDAPSARGVHIVHESQRDAEPDAFWAQRYFFMTARKIFFYSPKTRRNGDFPLENRRFFLFSSLFNQIAGSVGKSRYSAGLFRVMIPF